MTVPRRTLNPGTRPATPKGHGPEHRLEADICVVGAGVAGISAALEAARLGRRTVLVEAAPTLGGQSVNAAIGTFCGLFGNGLDPRQVTYGMASDILRDLGAAGELSWRSGRNTIVVLYNQIALARWVEEAVRQSAIIPVLGAVLRTAELDGRRLRRIGLATAYGDVEVAATGFVDASGDAALAWHAGLPLQEPEKEVMGTQMFVLEGIDVDAVRALDLAEVKTRLAEKADAHGLLRHDGFVFAFPEKGTGLVNMTHIHTPLDAVGMSRAVLEGRAQADRLLRLLRDEFPAAFGAATVRQYGLPGVRQTRWITGTKQLTVDEVRAGVRFDDAVGRCSWPIELHDDEREVYWETFGDDHMHWIPLASLTPRDADNIVAAGRCLDADSVALASVRVMGPCIAMGAAAAHALDLAGSGSVHQVDVGALQARLRDNLEGDEKAPFKLC